MKGISYQISNNLRIEEGKVISYSTVVARIEGKRLLVNGKYSRTTSKHLLSVVRLLELENIEYLSGKKKDFDWYERGVKCTDSEAITPKSSIPLLREIAKGKTLFEAVYEVKQFPKRDWEKLRDHLQFPPDCKPPNKQPFKWHKI